MGWCWGTAAANPQGKRSPSCLPPTQQRQQPGSPPPRTRGSQSSRQSGKSIFPASETGKARKGRPGGQTQLTGSLFPQPPEGGISAGHSLFLLRGRGRPQAFPGEVDAGRRFTGNRPRERRYVMERRRRARRRPHLQLEERVWKGRRAQPQGRRPGEKAGARDRGPRLPLPAPAPSVLPSRPPPPKPDAAEPPLPSLPALTVHPAPPLLPGSTAATSGFHRRRFRGVGGTSADSRESPALAERSRGSEGAGSLTAWAESHRDRAVPGRRRGHMGAGPYRGRV